MTIRQLYGHTNGPALTLANILNTGTVSISIGKDISKRTYSDAHMVLPKRATDHQAKFGITTQPSPHQIDAIFIVYKINILCRIQ